MTSTRTGTKIELHLTFVPACVLLGCREFPCSTANGGSFMSSLYETILDLCQQKDIRPGRLCSQLGLSRGLMTDLKMGRKKSLSAETAQKIAAYFGVSVGYLLGQDTAAEATSASGKPDILEQVDIAFYGDFKELDEEQKEAVRDMVRLMWERRAARQRD